MCKQSSIRLGKIKSAVTKMPLPPNFSRILAVLLNHTDRNTYQCWPSKKGIARQVGCSEKTVARHLKVIIEQGLFRSETLGRQEMEFRIGRKIPGRDTSQRRYCLYELNPDHPFWKGEGVDKIITLVKESSSAGISKRLRKKKKPSPKNLLVSVEDSRNRILFPI